MSAERDGLSPPLTRGHGDSDWSPDQKYDSEDIGRDITAVLNTFDSPPAVVGASMGGMGASLLNVPQKVSYTQQS